MTMAIKKNTMIIRVHSKEQSADVQRALFSLGYEWAFHRKRTGTRTSEPHVAICAYSYRPPGKTDVVRRMRHLWQYSSYKIELEKEGAVDKDADELIEMTRVREKKAYFPYDESPERGWSFASRHAGDIDFITIAGDLTTKHPVALVRRGEAGPDDEVWVVVHYKLVLKSKLLDIDLLEGATNTRDERKDPARIEDYPSRDMRARVYRLPLRYTKALIEAVRMVKRMPWPNNEDKLACTVHVTRPEV
jgi:hypothetical protein